MGLQEVIGEVRRDGEARAQKILQDARAEAQRILDAASDKAAAAQAERQAQAERDAAQAAAQVRSSADFEARKVLLNAEADLRDELRRTVLEGFAALPKAQREKHIKALLATAKKAIPDGTVFGAAADHDALKKQRSYGHGGDVAILGGIVVEASDGLTRLDLSYETLLGDMWREVLRKEAGLFG